MGSGTQGWGGLRGPPPRTGTRQPRRAPGRAALPHTARSARHELRSFVLRRSKTLSPRWAVAYGV